MKKLIYILSILTVAGAIIMGAGGCQIHYGPEGTLNCLVVVKTTPSEETILLAKSEVASSFTNETISALLGDFQSENGEENISWNITNLTKRRNPVPNCYEITMTGDIAYPPYGWEEHILVSKEDGDVHIFKLYAWGFSESHINSIIAGIEDHYTKYGGEITNTVKNKLGPEVHNEPIIF